MTVALTADQADQVWLDERIAEARTGFEDATVALLDIAANWMEGRQLNRLHPGMSAAAYVSERLGPVGRQVVVPLLEGSDWSNRQIATVAGVDEGTVRGELRNLPQLERPAVTLGADGKYRPGRVVRQVDAQVLEPDRGPELAAAMDRLVPDDERRRYAMREAYTHLRLGRAALREWEPITEAEWDELSVYVNDLAALRPAGRKLEVME